MNIKWLKITYEFKAIMEKSLKFDDFLAQNVGAECKNTNT